MKPDKETARQILIDEIESHFFDPHRKEIIISKWHFDEIKKRYLGD